MSFLRTSFALAIIFTVGACQTTEGGSDTYTTTTGTNIGSGEKREVSDIHVNLDAHDFSMRPMRNTRTDLHNRVIFDYEASGNRRLDELNGQHNLAFNMQIESLHQGYFRFDGKRNVERTLAGFNPPVETDDVKRDKVFRGESSKSYFTTVQVGEWACTVFSGAFEISARSQMKDPTSILDGYYCIENTTNLAVAEQVAIKDLRRLRLRERNEFEF